MSLFEDIQHIFNSSRRLLVLLFAIFLPVLYVLSGFYSIDAEQRGILIRFGQIIDDDIAPGMNYHLPWPMESVIKLPVTELRSMELDLSAEIDKQLQTELTTGNGDLVDVALSVQYNISDAGHYTTISNEADLLLQHYVVSETLFYIGGSDIDRLLTTGRSQFQSRVRTAVQEQLNTLDLGLRVTSVQIQRLEPPKSIKRAFDAVDSARSERQKLIQEARGEHNARLAEARSKANRTLKSSEAEASELIQRAQGDTALLMAGLEQYKKNPELTGSSIYYSNLERIFERINLYVVPAE